MRPQPSSIRRKVPVKDTSYSMDHAAPVHLTDLHGRIAGTVSAGKRDKTAAIAKLRHWVEQRS